MKKSYYAVLFVVIIAGVAALTVYNLGFTLSDENEHAIAYDIADEVSTLFMFENMVSIELIHFDTESALVLLTNNSNNTFCFHSNLNFYFPQGSSKIEYFYSEQWLRIPLYHWVLEPPKILDAFNVTIVNPGESALAEHNISFFDITNFFNDVGPGVYRFRKPIFLTRYFRREDWHIGYFKREQYQFLGLSQISDNRMWYDRGHDLIVEFFWDGEEFHPID